MAKKPTLAAALKALQANLTSRTPIPEDHMTVLRETIAGRRVLTLSGTALDIDQIEADLAHLDLTGDDSAGDELKTLDEALQSARPALPACPVTGRDLRLVKGKNGAPDRLVTKDGTDWQPIATEQREVAAYAVSVGAITPTGDAAESAVYALQQRPLPPPWPRLSAAWVSLRDKSKKTPAEAAQVASVQARLTFQRQEAPAAAGSSFPVETVTSGATVNAGGTGTGSVAGGGGPCEAGPCRSFDCTWPVCAAPGKAPAPTQGGAPLLFIKAAPAEFRYVEMLRKHLSIAVQKGKVALFDEGQIPAGVNTASYVGERLRRAAVVVYLVSSDLLTSLDFTTMQAAAPQARHVPLLARPSDYRDVFGGAVALPRDGRALSQQSDIDSAMVDVVAELRRALDARR